MIAKVVPQVSVIVPTYNRESYLKQAVDSVLKQQGCSYELIVIDDGSTDNTHQLLQPYRDRLRYVYQDNRGVCAARNRGIELAQGDFIAFLDADDFFFSDKLAAQIALFSAQPDLGIVHSGWCRVDSEGKKLLEVRLWENIPELNLESWLRWKPVLPSAMMFRRQWLELVGGFDSQYTVAEDVDLVLRLALKGCKSAWLPRLSVGYRQHEGSAMGNALSQGRDLSKLLDNFFSQPEVPPSIRLLEKQLRYGTLVWIAWYLYHTGQKREMLYYLQQSQRYSNYSPVATAISWTESFAEYSRNYGEKLDVDSLCLSQEWQELMRWLVKCPV